MQRDLPDHDTLTIALAPTVGAELATLRSALVSAGVPLVLCPADGPLDESLFVDLLLDGRIGALIVTAAHAADPALAEVAGTGRAVVAVDVERPAPGMVATTRPGAGAVLAALGLGSEHHPYATVRSPRHRRCHGIGSAHLGRAMR